MSTYFIRTLKYTIDNTEVYKPGKYGKKEIDGYETREEKMEKFLLAEPSTAEEVNDYVLFAQSINAFTSERVRKKIKTLLRYSKYSDDELRLARKIYNDDMLKRRLKSLVFIILSLVIITLSVLWYIFFVGDWGVFWKILWWICLAPLLCTGTIGALVGAFESEDNNPF